MWVAGGALSYGDGDQAGGDTEARDRERARDGGNVVCDSSDRTPLKFLKFLKFLPDCRWWARPGVLLKRFLNEAAALGEGKGVVGRGGGGEVGLAGVAGEFCAKACEAALEAIE